MIEVAYQNTVTVMININMRCIEIKMVGDIDYTILD